MINSSAFDIDHPQVYSTFIMGSGIEEQDHPEIKEPDLQACLFKEIELIQGIIRRMASNSFVLKGWAVTLVVVTLLLRGTGYQPLIAFIPLIGFWILDAYFVRQERMYRRLYIWVTKNRLANDSYLFDLNASRFRSEVEPPWRIMFSGTLLCFYGPILLLIGVYILIILTGATGG
jgi:hypothetical protein